MVSKLKTELTQRRKGAKKSVEEFRPPQFRFDFAVFLCAFAPLRETSSPASGVNHV
jgi:hypothetical protein